MIKKFLILNLSLISLIGLSTKTYAQSVCDFFGCDSVLPDPGQPLDMGLSLARFGVSLIFTGFVAMGVFMIIKSALKYIQSEGNDEGVEAGANIMRGVFIGIGILFIGIIGIVIVLGVFSDGNFLTETITPPEGVTL